MAVSGRLNQRKYTTRDNQQVTVIETIADSVEFLEPKSANGATPDASIRQQAPAQDYSDEAADSGNLDGIDVVSDDLPF